MTPRAGQGTGGGAERLPLPDRSAPKAPGVPEQAGELPSEFAQRFREAYRTLWTIAAGIVNDPFIAEDVVQEAAVTALGKLSEFEPNSNFTAWMAKIVRYIALNQSRRTRRQPANVDPGAMDDSLAARADGLARTPPVVDVHGRLDAQRTPFDDRVMHALNSVSDIARACLLLRTLQGLSYDEIAQALQIPPGTAMSHVHRTRLTLREKLAELNPTRDSSSSNIGKGGGRHG